MIVAIGLLGILAFRMPSGAGGPAPSPRASDDPAIESATPTPAATVAAVTSPTPEPAPAWTRDLAGQLDCDGPRPSLGGEVGEVSSSDPVSTPDAALALVLMPGLYASLPVRGWRTDVEIHWARHRYIVDGRLKALAVSTDVLADFPPESGWDVVGLLACDASEFDQEDGLTDESTLWVDAHGDPVRADRLFSRLGPGHCGWEHVTFLHFEGEQYLRDVKGVLDYATERTFRTVDRLPTNAVDTGFHTATLRIFTVPDGRSVYLQSPKGTIERWGHATEQIGCV